jgi:hypothetical protein
MMAAALPRYAALVAPVQGPVVPSSTDNMFSEPCCTDKRRCGVDHSSARRKPTVMPVPTDGAVTEESEIVDMKLEVLVVPVSDVDRATRFYETFGDAND